jgi:hypothetical protein
MLCCDLLNGAALDEEERGEKSRSNLKCIKKAKGNLRMSSQPIWLSSDFLLSHELTPIV